MKKQKQMFIWLAMAVLMLFSVGAQAQNPTYSLKLTNAQQVSCNVYEFDLVLQRTGTIAFKLAMFQVGININPAIIPSGGIINVSQVPGSSTILNPAQIPTADRFTFDALNNCIRITPMSPPGYAAGALIANNPTGTKLCRVRVSCSLPFVTTTHPNHTWSWSMATGYQTKIFAYVSNLNTDVTIQASHWLIPGTSGTYNPVFIGGFPDPAAQTVTSDMTTVCQIPGAGATISLTTTQAGYTYYLYVNGVAVPGITGVIFGNGAGASFGHLVDSGVVSVISPSCTGPISMLNTITLTPVTPLNASIAIVAAPGTSVPPGTPATITATPVNGGTTPTYAWFLNGTQDTTTGPVFHFTPINGDVIYCEMSSTETCVTPTTATSNALVFYVLPNAYNITLSGSKLVLTGSYCQGTGGLPVGLDSSDLNVVYTLHKNGVAQVPTVTGTGFPISFGNQLAGIYTITGNNTAGTIPMNDTVIITEIPAAPVSVSIVVDQNNLCSVVPVTYTATPVNGGTNPVYEWYLGASVVGSNQATYTNPTPANGDVVYVKLTSDAACATGSPATSNNIVMAILTPHAASVTIAANQNNVCQGATVNFLATPLFGGTTPTYQWYKNGSPVGSNSTLYSYVPANGDSVYVVMTSNYPCVTGSPATSNIVHMIINPILPVSVTAVPSVNNICSGTPVTFTATPTNGGPAPTYIWHVGGNSFPTGTTPSYTFTPTNGNTVNVTMTTSLPQCFTGSPATSGTTTMVVNPVLPASVNIVGPGGATPVNHYCINDTVHFNAAPTNGGTAPTYEWFLNTNPTPVSTSSLYKYISAVSTSDSIKLRMTSNLACVTGSPYIKGILIYADPCTGIEETSDNASSVIVYPNPTNDKLYVNFGDLKEAPNSMKVYNAMGQICFESDQPLMVNQSGIDVAKMSRGTYTLQIMFENDIVNKRFIVE